jgi:3-dehydroquinate synthetase
MTSAQDQDLSMRELIGGSFSLRSTRDHRFDVVLFDNLIAPDLRSLLASHTHGREVLAITTPTVARLFGAEMRRVFEHAGARPTWLVLNCGEATKTLDTVIAVCRAAMDAGVGRKGLLIAIGGGVCSDIVTVAASMLRRGIAHLRIPTTLIGQVDAGIGLKGGVNFGKHKSFLGCFHPPEVVAVVPYLLATLGSPGVLQGFAEMIKVACTSDPSLFALLEERATALLSKGMKSADLSPLDLAPTEGIKRAIAAMLAELSENPFETKTFERAVDFGHTIAHPLEGATHFSLHHGYAVAVDMAFSCVAGWRLGWLAEELALRILGLLAMVGLPIHHGALSQELVWIAFSTAAKHRGGSINMVIPKALGSYSFLKRSSELPKSLTGEIIAWLRAGQEAVDGASSGVLACKKRAEAFKVFASRGHCQCL